MKTILLVVGLLVVVSFGGWGAYSTRAAASADATPPCYPDGPLCQPCCK